MMPSRHDIYIPKFTQTALATYDAKSLVFTEQASGILPRVNASLMHEQKPKKTIPKIKVSKAWK